MLHDDHTDGNTAAQAILADVLWAHHAHGLDPIQLHTWTAGGCSCGEDCKKSGGKHPVGRGWQKAPRLDEQGIRAVFGDRVLNVGFRTGGGLFVLDLDGESGQEWYAGLPEVQATELDDTLGAWTGTGGRHFYFSYDPGAWVVGNRAGIVPGVDARGDGGFVVGPPSVSYAGRYDWADRCARIRPAPVWLLEFVTQRRPRVAAPVEERPAGVVLPVVDGGYRDRYLGRAFAGELGRLAAMRDAATDDPALYRGEPWDHGCFQVACNLVELGNAMGVDLDAVRDTFVGAAPLDDGFDERRVVEKWESAVRRVGGREREVPPQEYFGTVSPVGGRDDPLEGAVRGPGGGGAGGAWLPLPAGAGSVHAGHVVLASHGHLLLSVDGGPPTAWDRRVGVWRLGSRAAVQALVLEALEGYVAAAPADLDEDGLKELGRFKVKINRGPFISEVADVLSGVLSPGVRQVRSWDMDPDPMLLAFTNGVLDMRSGELRPAVPGDLMTGSTGVAYRDPGGAGCPNWFAFLESAQPDPVVREFLRRVAGYTLTGSTREQKFFLHHGPGGTGKSTFISVLWELLGDQGATVAGSMLLKSGQDSSRSYEFAKVKGLRAAVVEETPVRARWDDAQLKTLTGSTSVNARLPYQQPFSFRPTAKLHVVTNHPPNTSTDVSMRRRLVMVKWDQAVPADRLDKDLLDKLRSERDAIFAWALAGARDWYARGDLGVPAVVQGWTDDFFGGEDLLGQWLEEHTLVCEDRGRMVRGSDLHAAFVRDMRAAGEQLPSSSALSRELEGRGFPAVRTARANVRALMFRPDSPHAGVKHLV